ncbi:phage shock envelope stress response protein PspM [Amycolatopsis suaedae]|uniref:Uncharacterized protein n=1 Tax=Amycolatopsis suaedae TaxID=2510978 RepID=A0A4Q7J0G5_9PSEU|nr:hypothetical protein [Amycolatopsis suaedae]RZQ59863.1 hypothetical protein EWH70_32640 [Amycolatopsis suaedae]
MGSRKRRDFSDLSARLEKHIDRLPQYAQKAQETLQRYVPPKEGQQGEGREPKTYRLANPKQPELSVPQPPTPPVPPARPARPSMQDLTSMAAPALSDVKGRWDRWNHPAAKLERRKRWTSRFMTLWIVVTLLCGLAAAAFLTGLAAAGEAMFAGMAAVAAGVVSGTFAIRSGMKLHRLNRTEIPASAAPPPLPPMSSAAREPMQRLAESEATLAELLTQLSAAGASGAGAVPEVSVADARATAEEASAALRGLSGRIQAIERARNSAPAGERPALEAAVTTLRQQLDDGVDGYGGLIVAAGQAVAAAGSGLDPSREALTDATDRLAGLAMALRELS